MTFFETIICYKCKEEFGLSGETYRALHRSSANFHCPFGHVQRFASGPTEVDTLRRERDRLKQDAARLEDEKRLLRKRVDEVAAERRVSAAKGRITRMKNRAATGHCQCCGRVFVDLLSHMKSKHPEYEAEPIDLDAEAVQ